MMEMFAAIGILAVAAVVFVIFISGIIHLVDC